MCSLSVEKKKRKTMEDVFCDFCQDLISEKECPSCTNMVCKECLGKEDLCPDCKAPGHEVIFTDGYNECEMC